MSELSERLRKGLEAMAHQCTAPFELWQRFSNDVLMAANTLEPLTALSTKPSVADEVKVLREALKPFADQGRNPILKGMPEGAHLVHAAKAYDAKAALAVVEGKK